MTNPNTPEGATHYDPDDFYPSYMKKEGSRWYFWSREWDEWLGIDITEEEEKEFHTVEEWLEMSGES